MSYFAAAAVRLCDSPLQQALEAARSRSKNELVQLQAKLVDDIIQFIVAAQPGTDSEGTKEILRGESAFFKVLEIDVGSLSTGVKLRRQSSRK